MFHFISINQSIGREGWTFCTSQEIGWEEHLSTLIVRCVIDVVLTLVGLSGVVPLLCNSR